MGTIPCERNKHVQGQILGHSDISVDPIIWLSLLGQSVTSHVELCISFNGHQAEVHVNRVEALSSPDSTQVTESTTSGHTTALATALALTLHEGFPWLTHFQPAICIARRNQSPISHPPQSDA